MFDHGSVGTEAVALLSSGLISVPIGAETVAVLSRRRPSDGYRAASSRRNTATSMVTGAWIVVIVPRLHVVPEHDPCEGVIDAILISGSSNSLSWTFAAS